MPRWCEHVDMPNGHMIVCHSGHDPRQRCAICGVKGADRLCDWPVYGPFTKDYTGDYEAKKHTCDRPLCRRCARHPIPEFGEPGSDEIDYCPEHYALYKAQMLEIKTDAPGEK